VYGSVNVRLLREINHQPQMDNNDNNTIIGLATTDRTERSESTAPRYVRCRDRQQQQYKKGTRRRTRTKTIPRRDACAVMAARDTWRHALAATNRDLCLFALQFMR
jgi:hypothetical protein